MALQMEDAWTGLSQNGLARTAVAVSCPCMSKDTPDLGVRPGLDSMATRQGVSLPRQAQQLGATGMIPGRDSGLLISARMV